MIFFVFYLQFDNNTRKSVKQDMPMTDIARRRSKAGLAVDSRWRIFFNYQMNKQLPKHLAVWDPLIRIFHWSLAVFFVVAYALDDSWILLHSYSGYSILLLLGFRLVWGFIGTPYARFSNFLVSPKRVIHYLHMLLRGSPQRFIGHNPAGGAMIAALLLVLAFTTLSGICLLAIEGSGPLRNSVAAQWPGGVVQQVHDISSQFTIVLVALHIVGVFVSSYLHKENLVRAMFNGKKSEKPAGSDS